MRAGRAVNAATGWQRRRLDGHGTPVGLEYAPAAAPAPVAPSADAPALPCPLCEYDLRGLSEPRCPECGYTFTWGELGDPRRRFHPYLFEHHPRRNAWSFVQTLLGGLTPRAFWSTLHPTQPSRPRRLVGYWVLYSLPLMALAAVHWGLLIDGLFRSLGAARAGSYDAVRLARWVMSYDADGGAYGLLALCCLAWPWLTFLALLVFQVSLRRARLRTTHVLRCVLYSGDACLWLALPLGFLGFTAWAASGWPPRAFFPSVTAAVPWVVLPWLTYRLFAAYRHYLRFDHALATVLASQVIVLLVFIKLGYVARGF